MESINFVWEKEDEWLDKFEELKSFKLENNRNPPRDHPSLGRCCQTQRKYYKESRLSQEQIDLLESVNLMWSVKQEWQVKFNELKAFKLENNGSNPPYKDSSLGRWCSTQRVNYRKGNLSQERIDLLENIEGWQWEIQ